MQARKLKLSIRYARHIPSDEEWEELGPYFQEQVNPSALRERLLLAEDFPCLIAAHDHKKCVGFLLIANEDILTADTQEIVPTKWIHRLFVIEERRKEGIGTALMHAAEDYAKERAIKELWLDTLKAGAFYRNKLDGYLYQGKEPYRGAYVELFRKAL